MESGHSNPIESAEVVLPSGEIHDTLAFFTERLGFRLDAIFPADAPAVAVISGHGLRLRLQREAPGAPGVIRLKCRDPASFARGTTEVVAPNGTRIEIVPLDATPALPPLQPAFVLTRMGQDSPWGVGRAAMQYRDLIPDRQGGRFIASHIRIPNGGPVSDLVHSHDIHFQLIYCYRGWVRVVYEDQGLPFVMRAGDCVLQPPKIRHRVLECSDGLEVIEITSPAHHFTVIDHALALPTVTRRRDGTFAGQHFLRHEAGAAQWLPGGLDGFESRTIGIGEATGGLAEARVHRRAARDPMVRVHRHNAELMFAFVLAGSLTLRCDGAGAQALKPGDSLVLPAGLRYALASSSSDLQLLEVTCPAKIEIAADPKASVLDLK